MCVAAVSPISAGNTPGMMVLTPNRAQTLVFSGNGTPSSDNQFTIISNAGESASSHVDLPGMTQSFVVSPDSSTAYVAVPTAPVVGQSPGAIEVISLSTGAVIAEISCPTANPATPPAPGPPRCPGIQPTLQFSLHRQYRQSHPGFQRGLRLRFGREYGCGDHSVECRDGESGHHFRYWRWHTSFDHPVWAFFNSDDTTAYVLNCGAECGGTTGQHSTARFDDDSPDSRHTRSRSGRDRRFGQTTQPSISRARPLARLALHPGTAATSCGLLTIFDLNTMSVVTQHAPRSSSPTDITPACRWAPTDNSSSARVLAPRSFRPSRRRRGRDPRLPFHLQHAEYGGGERSARRRANSSGEWRRDRHPTHHLALGGVCGPGRIASCLRRHHRCLGVQPERSQ